MTDAIAQLRAAFLARCARDLAELRDLTPTDPRTAQIIHRLAGAAGSFGHPELGALAAQLDEDARTSGGITSADLQALLSAMVDLGTDGAHGL